MRLNEPWLDADATRTVLGLLTEAGHQAWIVGGAVRDALLGREVHDLDISTDAEPRRVMSLAEAAGLHVVPTGIDHGTVTVIVGATPFEVTTFRRDVETDGRRAVVAFADSLEEDARRRDFTLNALYCAPDGEVRDPTGGLADLEARQIRFIGTPAERIREDYLRILRFFRFHAFFGGDGIDPEGLAACAAEQEGIDRLSRERVGGEFFRLLEAPDPAPAVATMERSGILARVLPGAHGGTLAPLVHVEARLGLGPDPIRRLAALGGTDEMTALRLSRANARALSDLRAALVSDDPAAALGYRYGQDTARSVLALRAAVTGQEPDPDAGKTVDFGASQQLPVEARDLMPAYEGPALGARLAELETAWIASGFTLDREALLNFPPATG